MKKLAVITVFALVASTLWADYAKFGIGVNVFVDNTKNTDVTGVEDKDSYMYISPLFSIMLNESMELIPYLFYIRETEVNNSSTVLEANTFGGGASILWHFVRAKYIRLGTGVTAEFGVRTADNPLYLRDDTTSVGIMIPLFIEVPLARWVSFRATLDVFSFNAEFRGTDSGAGDETSVDYSINSTNWASNFYIGAIIRFGG